MDSDGRLPIGAAEYLSGLVATIGYTSVLLRWAHVSQRYAHPTTPISIVDLRALLQAVVQNISGVPKHKDLKQLNSACT
ncbi:hypothetical protein P171DRAFT_433195 [Karstenula rhodostoma CBS 690.94]|uniref:Uncharacterized protein n=1 Tax=Karstenula rhodostoma CBS 690.94 TaxID=1392251 RepID=A0A9P4PES5_9PLEO|nr:hypothetical protein P171DRAFT_433195 [Karstenula rhodostoma CBS 690.94]